MHFAYKLYYTHTSMCIEHGITMCTSVCCFRCCWTKRRRKKMKDDRLTVILSWADAVWHAFVLRQLLWIVYHNFIQRKRPSHRLRPHDNTAQCWRGLRTILHSKRVAVFLRCLCHNTIYLFHGIFFSYATLSFFLSFVASQPNLPDPLSPFVWQLFFSFYYFVSLDSCLFASLFNAISTETARKMFHELRM